jgi:hypothetical protein
MNTYLLILIVLLFILYTGAFLLRRWKWFSNLCLTGASVLFILLAAEFIYRWFFRQKEPVAINQCGTNCFQHDSLLGFKPALPGNWKIVTVARGIDTIVNTSYTIVADTFHSGLNYDHRMGYSDDSSQKEAVFLGCSFTFGSSISDSATLPYQLGRAAHLSTVNLGCPAYGLHQVYELFISKYSKADNHKRVFVYSLLSDHFYRAAGVYEWNVNGPYFEQQGDSLIYKGPVHNNIRMPYRRAPYLLSFFGGLSLVYDKLDDMLLRKRMKAFSKKEYDRIFLMLREMNAGIAKTGGKLIILNWDRSNWGYQGYEFPFQQQLDKDAGNFTTINVSSILNYNDPSNFIPLDGHPTYIANQRIAEYLVNKFPKQLH